MSQQITSRQNQETLTSSCHEKHVPSTMLPPAARPRNVKELNDEMERMDKVNGTSFKGWILDESNIGYVCTFKRHLWENNWETHPESVFISLQFLSSYGDWKVPSVAELILKMFHHWGVDSPRFGALVNGLVRGLSHSKEELKPTDNSEIEWTKRRIYDCKLFLS